MGTELALPGTIKLPLKRPIETSILGAAIRGNTIRGAPIRGDAFSEGRVHCRAITRGEERRGREAPTAKWLKCNNRSALCTINNADISEFVYEKDFAT